MMMTHLQERSVMTLFPSNGATWRPVTVIEDGSCLPAAKTKCSDRLWVKMAYYLGTRVYNCVNLTKGYQCFVQLHVFPKDGYMRGPHAMCTHPECVKWQHTQSQQRTPCKHIRAVVRWHVKLTRRAKRLSEKGQNVST
jgi:hypothetical protein